MEQAWLVVVIGVTVVFAALLLLILVFTIFGKVMHSATKGGKTREEKQSKIAVKKDTPAVVNLAPAVQPGISNEVVAAISAAIAAYTGGAPVIIRSVRKQQATSGRSAWAKAGLAENTRPF